MEEKEECIEDLLLRYFDGTTTKDETQQVEYWMESSDKNRRLATKIQTIAMAVDVAEITQELDAEKTLESIHKKIDTSFTVKKKVNRYNLYKWIQRVAAVLFIPTLILVCMEKMEKTTEQVEMMEVKTSPGVITSVTLSDGTKVVLNSSSSLRYPSSFKEGDKRDVYLEGEAFFSVTKDKEKMFVVNTLNNSHIQVFGTEFNVKAYEGKGLVQTTLVSGVIDFVCKNDMREQRLRMEPGQKVIYNAIDNSVVLKNADVEQDTSWKDGRLIFRNTPFDEVLDVLGERYNVHFVLKNPALKQNAFTSAFTNQRLERILEIFRISSNIRFKYVEDDDVNNEKQIIEVY